jgi:hypothetical protein
MFNDIILYNYVEVPRIVIIGDVHGDLKRFKNILFDAKIINNNLEWIAEPQNTIVVQLGDQVDSANRDNLDNLNNTNERNWEIMKDVEMIYFTNSLDDIAKSKGGKVISLIGNHELMNVIGDYTYVSNNSKYDLRTSQFKPCGSISNILAKRPIVLKIGKLLFCHAGLKKYHIDILDKYNKDISYINNIWKDFVLKNRVLLEDKEIFDNIILGNDGILWTRNLDDPDTVSSILSRLKCIYMFIGHTPMPTIKLLNNQIWYTDTGISRSFGTTSYQYIDINNYNIDVKTIYE